MSAVIAAIVDAGAFIMGRNMFGPVRGEWTGDGLRLFQGVGRVDLEQLSVRPAALANHVRYRVRRSRRA